MYRTSIFIDINWHAACRKWVATVTHKGKNRYIGLFDSELDAVEARVEVLKELRGKDFCCYNIIKECESTKQE